MRYNPRLASYVNSNLSLEEEWTRVFGRPPSAAGKVFCPFHMNVNTPSAKIYGNYLKCWSCGKSYSVYDFLVRFNPGRLSEISGSIRLPEVPVAGSRKEFRFIPRAELDFSMSRLSLFDFIINVDR